MREGLFPDFPGRQTRGQTLAAFLHLTGALRTGLSAADRACRSKFAEETFQEEAWRVMAR